MIVTAGAGDCQTEHRSSGRVDLFVDNVHPDLLFVGLGECFRTDHQKAGGNDPFGGFLRIGVGQQIAGQLMPQKLVVRPVAVERFDNPVAIPERVPHHEVAVVGCRVGVPDNVEPVTAPPFAVVRRGEQTVNDLCECDFVRSSIIHESIDLSRCRRQTDQVVGDSPNQRHAVGLRGRFQSGGVELRENELIDRRPRPVFAGDGGQRRIAHGLKRPVRFLVLGEVTR